jgi:hypothetical protein
LAEGARCAKKKNRSSSQGGSMQALNRSPRWTGALPALTCAALACAAQAVTPTQPSGHQTPGAGATALKSAAPNPTTPKWQSGVGEWVGAPCRLIVQSDNGRDVEADCFTAGGLHHYYKARYVASDRIEGTVTRVDPSGCEVAVPMSVHITDANNFEFTHPGFTGCGVNNAGPANAYPVRRANPVATTGATSATSATNSTGATNSKSTTAASTTSKSAPTTSAQTHTAGGATTAATAAGGAKPATPAPLHLATTTNTPQKKVALVTKPEIKPPVKLPLKTEGPN